MRELYGYEVFDLGIKRGIWMSGGRFFGSFRGLGRVRRGGHGRRLDDQAEVGVVVWSEDWYFGLLNHLNPS